MTESMPTEVEFSLFAQGIDAIKSKNPQFRFNPNIMADLKSGTVYEFLISNDYFNNALRYFLSCESIQNNATIRAELPNQSLYNDYFVLSLMGIASQAFSSYLNATRCPRDWIKVVTKKRKETCYCGLRLLVRRSYKCASSSASSC